MSDLEPIRSAGAPDAIGPYSQAIRCGNLLFCSGQIPLDPKTRQMQNETIEQATEQCLRNLQAVLSTAGCSLSDVVKTTVYLTDLKEFPAMNATYAAFFGNHKPARATVQVAALPAGARVEIDCIAVHSQS
jgi:2-iminobutanoate/2-iminopropanoate deaminase